MEPTGTSRSCPSEPTRQVAGRHVVGQPDAVGGLVEGVAGRVHGRGVHRQDDGRLAARAHLRRGRRGGGRTRWMRTSRGTPPPSPRPSPAPGRAREFIGHTATPTILEGPLRRCGPALLCRPPDPEVASARVVWRRSERSRTLRCGLGSGSPVGATEVVSASAWEAWSRAAPGGMVARGRADRNQARRDRGRSPGSREEAGEALERLAQAHLHRRHRLAEGSEFCVRGVERRRA
jgi:hypothetical protein